jgi:exonuclease I
MNIVFTLNKTLTNESKTGLRPGAVELLEKLNKEKHNLILWTDLNKSETITFLIKKDIKKYFSKVIAREDFNPDEESNPIKNIKIIKGDVLIDNEPIQAKFGKENNYPVILIDTFEEDKEESISKDEWVKIYKKIKNVDRNILFKIKKFFIG